MNVRNRSVVLAAVGGGVILLAGVMTTRNDVPAAQRPGRVRATAQQTRRGEVPLNDVKLETLHRAPGTLDEPGRNPFRFEARSSPAPSAAGAPPRTATASPVPARIPPPAPPTGPAGPPPIALKFIGLVEAPSQAGRVAILSDGRGNVFYGREGDAIEGQYRMLKISPELIELSYMDGRGRQTIRLSGQ
jgi:hypothetical protein